MKESLSNFKVFEELQVTLSALLIIVLILIVTIVVTFILKRILIVRVLRRSGERDSRLYSIFTLIKYFLWVLAITSSMQVIGLNLTFLLASSAALLVGIGLGLQQTFNDIVSGIIILVEGSLHVNDIVEVNNQIGKVQQINLRTSKVYTLDGIYIIVPNSKFINERVINWSHLNKITRFNILIGVSYHSDVEKVKDALLEVAEEHPSIINNAKYPNSVLISEFADSAIVFQLFFWTKDAFGIQKIKGELRFNIVKKLKEKGVDIPFPQRDIHLISDQTKTAIIEKIKK